MNSIVPADLLELKPRLETWQTNREYAREPILRSTLVGGESFALVTLGYRKHTSIPHFP